MSRPEILFGTRYREFQSFFRGRIFMRLLFSIEIADHIAVDIDGHGLIAAQHVFCVKMSL